MLGKVVVMVMVHCQIDKSLRVGIHVGDNVDELFEVPVLERGRISQMSKKRK